MPTTRPPHPSHTLPVAEPNEFTMPSSPVKPHQPLHNFSLKYLKWSMNHTNNHRFRKPPAADSPHKFPLRHAADPPHPPKTRYSAPSPDRKVEKSEKMSNLFAGAAGTSLKKSAVYGGTAEDSEWKSALSAGIPENNDKKSAVSAIAAHNPERKSKLCIRIRTNSVDSRLTKRHNDDVADDHEPADDVADAGAQNFVTEDGDEEEETLIKTWNLRPRRAATKPPNPNERALKIGGAAAQEVKAHISSRSDLTRSCNASDAKEAEKKDKGKGKVKEKPQKFSIPLTKEEVEDDFYLLTGSKPARRPKKRAKHVQKQLDFVFPGMWLDSITPDSYRVSDNP